MFKFIPETGAECRVDTYIRWYNEWRIKMSLGAVSPETYRQQLSITR